MAFLGKTYVQTGHNNYDGFLSALGPIPEDNKKDLLNHKSTTKLTQNGDTFTLAILQPNELKELTFKNGEPFAETVPGNNTCQTTITLDGNTLTQVKKTGPKTLTIKRVFSADQMISTLTMDGWNGTATITYKAE